MDLEFVRYLTDSNVYGFIFFFVRISAFFAFFPIFDSMQINQRSKMALSFFITVLVAPSLPAIPPMENYQVLIGVIGEVTFGLIASFALKVTIESLELATSSISMMSGLTMANSIDPSTGTQKAIIGTLLSMVLVQMLLASNFHHLVIMLAYQSIALVPLGGFALTNSIIEYAKTAMTTFYFLGFTIGFPMFGLMLILDTMFGMIAKTAPQFNLFSAGFPLKITLAFLLMMAILEPAVDTMVKAVMASFDSVQLVLKPKA